MLGNIHINWYHIYECDTHLIGKFAQLKLAHTETESSGSPLRWLRGRLWGRVHLTCHSWDWQKSTAILGMVYVGHLFYGGWDNFSWGSGAGGGLIEEERGGGGLLGGCAHQLCRRGRVGRVQGGKRVRAHITTGLVTGSASHAWQEIPNPCSWDACFSQILLSDVFRLLPLGPPCAS